MGKNFVNENGNGKDKKVKLSAPWIIYANQVKAMFNEDPDVMVEYNDAEKILTLRVNGEDKADAIARLLGEEKEFGNIKMLIRVIPANDLNSEKMDLFRRAFSGNPVVSGFASIDTLWGTVNFVVFKPKVVQYYSDELYDLNGITTTIYQDLAKESFGFNDGVFFSTDKIED